MGVDCMKMLTEYRPERQKDQKHLSQCTTNSFLTTAFWCACYPINSHHCALGYFMKTVGVRTTKGSIDGPLRSARGILIELKQSASNFRPDGDKSYFGTLLPELPYTRSLYRLNRTAQSVGTRFNLWFCDLHRPQTTRSAFIYMHVYIFVFFFTELLRMECITR